MSTTDTLYEIAIAAKLIHTEKNSLEMKAARLQLLEPIQATPHYRRSAKGEPRYLYLIYPQRQGQRQRTYIGSDPDKIAAAMARVQAHRNLTRVQHKIASLQERLDRVARYLSAALATAQEDTR